MKQKLFFITLFLPCFLTLQAQCCHSSDSIIYRNAYNHIVADSFFVEKSIYVSNQLTGTWYMGFDEEFDKLKDMKDRESYYRKLYQLDEEHDSNLIYDCFDKWFGKYTKSNNYTSADTVLAFSVIVNHDLFATVYLGNYNDKWFGETVFYYFTFDSNGVLTSSRKKLLHGL